MSTGFLVKPRMTELTADDCLGTLLGEGRVFVNS